MPVAPPPPEVLTRFGAGRDPRPLPGGQGTAWLAGETVLKPLDMPAAALAWQHEVLGALVPRGFRIAVPRRSDAGELVVDDWTAWPALAGSPAPRWREIIDVGGRFHDALAGVGRPAFLDDRTDRWARADRIAAGLEPPGELGRLEDAARLLDALPPLTGPEQLVHGDLTDNVLFADGLDPAIIDVSPYWRSPGFGAAIVAVDAVVWHGADAVILTTPPCDDQSIARALLFRLLSEPDPAAAAPRYRPTVDRVLERAVRPPSGPSV